jgi:hypothetical protein
MPRPSHQGLVETHCEVQMSSGKPHPESPHVWGPQLFWRPIAWLRAQDPQTGNSLPQSVYKRRMWTVGATILLIAGAIAWRVIAKS